MSNKKRGLFEFVFGKKKQIQNVSQVQLKMLNSFNAVFTTLNKNTYDSKVARECIDRIATHCAKLVPKHIQNSISNNIRGDINFLLQNQPNPLDTTYDFIYRIISILYTDSNVFIYIDKDKSGMITGFYPIWAMNYELYEDRSGQIFLQFDFVNGKKHLLPYLDLIHLRLFYNRHDIFGTNNKVLNTDIQTAHTASEGIKNAIKTSNNLKGLLIYDGYLKEKDIVKNKEDFVNDFLNLENDSGIAALDGKAKFQEIEMKPITLDKEQLKQVNYNIFDYFGVSEKIINNSYTPEEWNAFYEGVIETRAIQLSYAFTNKIFSTQARKNGHKIVFTANRLQYASLANKISLLKEAGALGLITKDEAREIIDLHPLGGEEGAKIIQSLNNIDSSIANDYQKGG